jgi:hypothetical protein
MKLRTSSVLVLVAFLVATSCALSAQVVIYLPYIQPGDSGPFGTSDQMVIAWQTNETSPEPAAYSVSVANNPEYQQAKQFSVAGRAVDNYLSADPDVFGSLSIPTACGPHVDYYAVLTGLEFGRQYYYQVTGRGCRLADSRLPFVHVSGRDIFRSRFRGMRATIPGFPTPAQSWSPTMKRGSSI